MSETRFSKLSGKFRWFATELVMIVTGILVALAINTWWVNLETAEREQVYLQDLVHDFEENAWRIGETLKDADEVIEAAQILLDVNSEGEGRAIGLDSLNYLLQSLSIMPTYQPVTRTWDDILGAGELQTLSNPEIRMVLAEFKSTMQLVEIVEQTQERQLVEIFVPYIMDHLDYAAVALFAGEDIEYPDAPYQDTVLDVLGTRGFRNWLVLRLTWADDLQGVHLGVQDLVKDIQSELADELGDSD